MPALNDYRRRSIAIVVFSIVAHGLSALPGIALYARSIASLTAGSPEQGAVEEAPSNRTGR